ncbi:alpha/beta-Hydrolases superfamily protein isoform X2 [Wolffia australiana]
MQQLGDDSVHGAAGRVVRFQRPLHRDWRWFLGFLGHAFDGSGKRCLREDYFLRQVKKMEELSKGYHIVGLSQGNLIGRAVVEFCDGSPPVKNFISLGGPHAGIASIPLCGLSIICIIVDNLIKSEVYSDYVQSHLAPSGYIKIPTDISEYLDKCRFLPQLNNERPTSRNSTYKARFSSLQTLVLIMFENDNVLVPRETSWFGYYADGSFGDVLPAEETQLYKEDWIGLRALNEAGRVKKISVAGNHLGISRADMRKHIVPYLKDDGHKSRDVQGSLSLSLSHLWVSWEDALLGSPLYEK